MKTIDEQHLKEMQTDMAILAKELPTAPILRGSNLILRPIAVEDTELFLKWRNHRDVNKWFVFRNEITWDDHINWMAQHVVTGGDCRQFMVYAPVENGVLFEPVGCANIKDMNQSDRSGEYGIFIGKAEARGRGLGTEILKIMLQYAEESLGLKTVRARAYVENRASVTHFLKCDFQIIATLRDVVSTDGTTGDMYLMERRG